MQLKLKAPGINLLTQTNDEPLSTIAFNFNLRRYIQDDIAMSGDIGQVVDNCNGTYTAGAHTRPLLSSTSDVFGH
jgi:hypothetical protein